MSSTLPPGRADKWSLIILSSIAAFGVHLGHKSITLRIRPGHVNTPEIVKNAGLVRLQLVGIEFTAQDGMNAIQRTTTRRLCRVVRNQRFI